MTMELPTVHWVFAGACFLLCVRGGSAAPAECHFHAKASCEFEGKLYSLGESWTDRACMECTCLHPVGVGCCEMIQRPVDFPGWCQVRVELVTCKMVLVQTADPRLPCSPGEMSRDPSQGALHLPQPLDDFDD